MPETDSRYFMKQQRFSSSVPVFAPFHLGGIPRLWIPAFFVNYISTCCTCKYALIDATSPPFAALSLLRLRTQILIAERCLLHTLGFQMTVEHPYAAVMGLLKKLFSLGRGADGGKGVDKTLNRQLSQVKTPSLWLCFCLRSRNEVAGGGGRV